MSTVAHGARALRPDWRAAGDEFANGDFARLVLFGGANGARLAWHVLYRANSRAMYDAVVDANSGAILYRQNLSKDAANADIYTNHPGAAPAETVDLEDFGLPPGSTTLDGAFSHAWSDINDDNTAQPTEEIPPSSGTDFVYPFTDFNAAHPSGCSASLPCAWDRTSAPRGRPIASRTACRRSTWSRASTTISRALRSRSSDDRQLRGGGTAGRPVLTQT